MRKNALRQHFAAGHNAIMGWLGIPNSLSAEIMANAGWDAITIDMQHGAVPHGEIVPMLQAISTTNVTPLVRVPWNEPGIIMRVLDAGAYGIICPMVNTVKEAKALVAATRYPPLGARSNGPFRAMIYGGADYVQHANKEILVFAMIETTEAIKNLDEILKVEGIDGAYVGPSDLSLSMGEAPSLAPTAKKVIDGIKLIAERAAKAGLIAGVHCDSPKTVKERFGQGYRFGTILNDSRLLAVAAANAVKEARGEAATASAKTY
jgi:4-hydroxy-2-oxoheptanedioate aldolase